MKFLRFTQKKTGAVLETADPAYHDELYRRLSDKYAIPALNLQRTLTGLAGELTCLYLDSAFNNEDLNISRENFVSLLRTSLCYIFSQKCRVEPNIPENAFDGISNLNTYPKLNALGTAVFALCRPILKDIE